MPGFSGHSLRASLATALGSHAVEEHGITRHTRHRSVITLRRTIRDGELFTDTLRSRQIVSDARPASVARTCLFQARARSFGSNGSVAIRLRSNPAMENKPYPG